MRPYFAWIERGALDDVHAHACLESLPPPALEAIRAEALPLPGGEPDVLPAAKLAPFLRRLWKLDESPPADRIGHAPFFLGTETTVRGARDVYLAVRPSDGAFPMFLALRERAERATLVLVPTSRTFGPCGAGRYARGAHVEVTFLEESLSVEEGRIVRTVSERRARRRRATRTAQ